MNLRLIVTCVGAGLAAILGLASPGTAQSTNNPPVIVIGAAEIDPSGVIQLTDEGKKVLTDDITQLKAGNGAAFVMTASVDGKYWSSRWVDKTSFYSIEDAVRGALETCEYGAAAECFVVSINGHDGRTPNGDWPVQPKMFASDAGGAYDAGRVPFVTQADRSLLRAYSTAAGPRALAISSSGGWLWRSGKSIFEAVTTAGTDCQTNYPNQYCVLYAVNNTVVMTP